MRMFQISFSPGAGSVRVGEGISLLEAAYQAGFLIASECGGLGRCGRCLVEVEGGDVTPPSGVEQEVLGKSGARKGLRLACVTYPRSDLRVAIPATSFRVSPVIATEGVAGALPLRPNVTTVSFTASAATLGHQQSDEARLRAALPSEFYSVSVPLPVLRRLPYIWSDEAAHLTAVLIGDELADLRPQSDERGCLGLAVDIGTITVVAYLYDLRTGRRLGVASTVNPQSVHGADVISRMQKASSPDGLALLQYEMVSGIGDLAQQACAQGGSSLTDIMEVVVAGNTCMCHLLLGVSPTNIAATPFNPAFTEATTVLASEVGFTFHPRARVAVLPCVAGYVGADVVAGLVATKTYEAEAPTLYVDIGTNGEVVLVHNGHLWGCATAAGPAFEGGQIECGMRAAEGAIDRVFVNEELALTTLGGKEPIGICGSGLIDAVAALLQVGVVDDAGRFLPEEAPGSPLADRVESEDGVARLVLSPASAGQRQVYVSQRDVRQLQLAKAAVAAGAQVLLEEAGLAPEDLSRVVMAGAFGSFLDKRSALRVGLLPRVPLERIISVGNAAGSGASLALLSVAARAEAAHVAESVAYVELSSDARFISHFVEEMAFPTGEEAAAPGSAGYLTPKAVNRRI